MGLSLGSAVSAIVPPKIMQIVTPMPAATPTPAPVVTPTPAPAPVAETPAPAPVVYQPAPTPSEPVTYAAPAPAPPPAPAAGPTPTTPTATAPAPSADPAPTSESEPAVALASPALARQAPKAESKSMRESVVEARQTQASAVPKVETTPKTEPLAKPAEAALTYAQIIAQASSALVADAGGNGRVLDLIKA